MNVNNTAQISVHKLPNKNKNNKTKYLIIRWNQHIFIYYDFENFLKTAYSQNFVHAKLLKFLAKISLVEISPNKYYDTNFTQKLSKILSLNKEKMTL